MSESPSPSPTRALRIEYKGFTNVGESREYLLVLYRPEGPQELRFAIGIAAFGAGLIRPQDAPDFCYQKLLALAAAGLPTTGEVIGVEDAELVSYRVAHTAVPRRRASTTPARTEPAPVASRPAFGTRRPAAAPAPPPTVVPDPSSGFEQGQRVRHAVFGDGVTAPASAGHTVICFDDHGSKTFKTSLLELDVLSAPYVWETTARGKNRLRSAALMPE